MSSHVAQIVWNRGSHEHFVDHKYSRAHHWEFDGGMIVPASSSPDVVPLPFSVAANVDPEEAFVASLSSCHMLFFLSIAASKGFVVDRYTDNAVGVMGKGDSGSVEMIRVTLRPEVEFSGDRLPSIEQLESMHHESHHQCFIANSVKTQVLTEIVT